MADFLMFVASVAEAQQRAARTLGTVAVPGPEVLRERLVQGLPLLPRAAAELDPLWRKALAAILTALDGRQVPDPARLAMDRLRAEGHPDLDARAHRFLAGVTPATELAPGLFVAAALQVAWTAWASALDPALPRTLDPPGRCPVCGSPPVAATVMATPPLEGLRYLGCELCATSWYVPRAQCSQCQSDKDIAYFAFAESSGHGRGETCPKCRAYLKIFAEDASPGSEPFVDDLASLGLDLRLTEAGWHRISPHPFLLIGSG